METLSVPRPASHSSSASESHEVPRPIQSSDVLIAPLGELQCVAALAAAQVEDSIVALDSCGLDQQIDLFDGVLLPLNNVAIRLQVERVEKALPPVRRKMVFEVRHRPQGSWDRGLNGHSRVSYAHWSTVGSNRLYLRASWPFTE